MFKIGTKFYSIFHNKCPRCQQGKFFVHSGLFSWKNNLKLHERCSNCGLKYMIEPSFFYGAMYVSYGLTVAIAIAVFIICYLLGLSLVTSFIAIVITLILMTPILMRISRILYINMFVHFEKKYLNNEKEKTVDSQNS